MTSKADIAGSIMRENLAPFIIEYAAEKEDAFGVVSVVDVVVSKDYSYADFYVSAQKNSKDLPKFLSQFSGELKSMIGRDMGARKAPTIRFKIAKNGSSETDILSIIQEISEKYGLDKED